MAEQQLFTLHQDFYNEIAESFSLDNTIILHSGDTKDFLQTIPANSIMLSITSPPYNIGKDYELQVSIEEYLSEQEAVIDQLIRTVHRSGSICWQVGNYVQNGEVFPLDIFYYNLFKKHGLKLRNRIVWYFGHGLHASKRFSGRYETILWFTKSYVNIGKQRILDFLAGKLKIRPPGKPVYKPTGKEKISQIPQEWDEHTARDLFTT